MAASKKKLIAYKPGTFYWARLKPGLYERGRSTESFWTPVQFVENDEEDGPLFRTMELRYLISDAQYEEIGAEIKSTPA